MGDPEIGWIAAIIIGGIAGWLAEQFMKSDMGLLMNIVLRALRLVVRETEFCPGAGHRVRPTEGRLRLRQAGTGRFTRRAAKWPIQERGMRSQAITVGSRSGLWRLTAILMAQAIADLLRRRATLAALLQSPATQ